MDMTVKIKIGNVEVELTLEEAAELHTVLGRVCGKPEPVTVPMPYPVPYYVERYAPVPYWQKIWCSGSGNISLSTTGTYSTSNSLVFADADGKLHVGDKEVSA